MYGSTLRCFGLGVYRPIPTTTIIDQAGYHDGTGAPLHLRNLRMRQSRQRTRIILWIHIDNGIIIIRFGVPC
jgi:hypothetical protein